MCSFNDMFQIAKDLNSPPGIVHPLLIENYNWVDERLRNMYYSYAPTTSNCDEYNALNNDFNYDGVFDDSLYDKSNMRKRSESDISKYEEEIEKVIIRVNSQSPIQAGKIYPIFTNLFCSLNNDLINILDYDEDALSSINIKSYCDYVSINNNDDEYL